MEKMIYNKLAVAIVVPTGIMLATSVSAASVLAQRYTAPTPAPMSGNPSGNSPMKSGNTISSGDMMNKTGSGNMSNTDNTSASNMRKVRGGSQSKLSNAVSVGLKGLGNL